MTFFSDHHPFACRDLGVMNYAQAWQLQDRLREERLQGKCVDTVLLVEHPPVVTLGWRDCDEDLLVPAAEITSAGIEVIKTNRGGRATYHGPGQLVGYFICELGGLGMAVGDFVTAVEELCLRTLADFGIAGQRDPNHPGIWVGREKIAAVGLHFSRGVSQHGFALNVDPDLTHYRFILPCGIRDRGVTAMAKLLTPPPTIDDVKRSLSRHLVRNQSRQK